MQFSRVYKVFQTRRMSFQQQILQIKQENSGSGNFEKSTELCEIRK